MMPPALASVCGRGALTLFRYFRDRRGPAKGVVAAADGATWGSRAGEGACPPGAGSGWIPRSLAFDPAAFLSIMNRPPMPSDGIPSRPDLPADVPIAS